MNLHGFKYVYRPRNINILFNVDHNGMAAHLLMGFKKCCISTAMGEADEVMLLNDSNENGNVQCEC